VCSSDLLLRCLALLRITKSVNLPIRRSPDKKIWGLDACGEKI
jgi:hypothetical protein